MATVLHGSIQVNAAGYLSRLTGHKRRYSRVNRPRAEVAPLKQKPPPPSIESLTSGWYFDPEHVAPLHIQDYNKYTCCGRRCYEEWDAETLSRTRSALVAYGKGTQTARKAYVRECIAIETRQLHIRDGLKSLAVCWSFYRALMGVSFSLITSAGGVGPVHM